MINFWSCLVPGSNDGVPRTLVHTLCFCLWSQGTIVQSLNSPFFPPPIGAEPGRAKTESRITCMRMLRTPQFFPPNRGENHIWIYFPDSACGTIFWIIIIIIMYKQHFLYSDWLKTCQLMPNRWNFTSATLNHIRFVFYHNIKDNERNLCQDLLTIENTNSDLKVHALHYANELLVRVRLSFQKLLQTRSTWRKINGVIKNRESAGSTFPTTSI